MLITLFSPPSRPTLNHPSESFSITSMANENVSLPASLIPHDHDLMSTVFQDRQHGCFPDFIFSFLQKPLTTDSHECLGDNSEKATLTPKHSHWPLKHSHLEDHCHFGIYGQHSLLSIGIPLPSRFSSKQSP